MTLTEFLAWEDRQDFKHEFDGYGPIAMSGWTVAHAIIQANLAMVLGSRLRGQPCRFYGSDMKIEVMGRIRYPDGMVSCTTQARDGKILRDPIVLFEVLSDSSGSTDLVAKNREYASTPSVRRYVMLSQNEIGAVLFERVEADWLGRVLAADAVLTMPEIGVEVALSELYTGLDFTADPTSAPSS